MSGMPSSAAPIMRRVAAGRLLSMPPMVGVCAKVKTRRLSDRIPVLGRSGDWGPHGSSPAIEANRTGERSEDPHPVCRLILGRKPHDHSRGRRLPAELLLQLVQRHDDRPRRSAPSFVPRVEDSADVIGHRGDSRIGVGSRQGGPGTDATSRCPPTENSGTDPKSASTGNNGGTRAEHQ